MKPTPALTLHHVGVLVENIRTESVNFVNRFGYVVESATIEDPAQTALVLFLRQRGASSWVELIAPNGDDSKLKNALKQGGGLHHFCYETDDLDEACKTLRSQGMMMVGDPVLAVAFPGRRIAWFMGKNRLLVELLQSGEGPLSLRSIVAGA